jgi:hypothetical protein
VGGFGMILYNDGSGQKRYTPNEVAKLLILDWCEKAREFWFETSGLEYDRLTKGETEKVDALVNKHVDRIHKIFGLS